MSLAQLNSSEVSTIDTSHKNLVLRFENRIKCLNAIFWNIHQALSIEERTLLILDRKEDLEYINYFLSKYDLKPLSIIISPRKEYISPVVINNLNNKQELITTPNNNEKIELTIEQLLENIKSHLSQLRSPQLGKLNVLDIFERSKLTPLQYHQLNVDLFQMIPFDSYKSKKALMREASNLFQMEYNHKAKLNPIKEGFILNNSEDSIQVLFSDLIEDLSAIRKSLSEVKNQIEHEISKDTLKQTNQINAIVFKIKKYNKYESLSESDYQNLKLLIDKFNATCPVKFVPTSDYKQNIKETENAFIRFIAQLNEDKKDSIKKALSHINNYNAGELAEQIFKKTQKVSKKINGLNCFKEWHVSEACTLQSCITINEVLLDKLEFAKYFLQDSKSYIDWIRFVNGLAKGDKEIIHAFTKVKSDWVEVFESNYLEGFVKSELVQLQDIQPMQMQLMDLVSQYEQSYASQIHSKYINQERSDILPAINGDLTKIAWEDFLNSKSTELFTKFPLVITDSQSYSQHAKRFESVVDKTIIINGLPEVLPSQEWSRNVLAGYTTEFNNDIVKLTKKLDDVSIQSYSGTEFNINRSMRNMNTSEINMLSLYLGQSIHKLNDNYKIFQLKDKAIVSFLKDDKNAELLQLISSYGAKEIFTTEANYNLLPGVLANPDSETILLLEDSLIAVNPDDFDLRQLLLIDKIKTAGFKVVSVNNFKLLTDNNYTLSKLIVNLLGQQNDAFVKV